MGFLEPKLLFLSFPMYLSVSSLKQNSVCAMAVIRGLGLTSIKPSFYAMFSPFNTSYSHNRLIGFSISDNQGPQPSGLLRNLLTVIHLINCTTLF